MNEKRDSCLPCHVLHEIVDMRLNPTQETHSGLYAQGKEVDDVLDVLIDLQEDEVHPRVRRMRMKRVVTLEEEPKIVTQEELKKRSSSIPREVLQEIIDVSMKHTDSDSDDDSNSFCGDSLDGIDSAVKVQKTAEEANKKPAAQVNAGSLFRAASEPVKVPAASCVGAHRMPGLGASVRMHFRQVPRPVRQPARPSRHSMSCVRSVWQDSFSFSIGRGNCSSVLQTPSKAQDVIDWTEEDTTSLMGESSEFHLPEAVPIRASLVRRESSIRNAYQELQDLQQLVEEDLRQLVAAQEAEMEQMKQQQQSFQETAVVAEPLTVSNKKQSRRMPKLKPVRKWFQKKIGK